MPTLAIRYTPPTPRPESSPSYLVARPGTAGETCLPFYDQIEIGRDDGRPGVPGILLIDASGVSRRHCIVSHQPDGRFFVRDLSLNGTRIDGRRLVPNVEMEWRPGQRISVADEFELVLKGPPPRTAPNPTVDDLASSTLPASALAFASVLVGDICNYTVLVREVPPATLQQSVNGVFEILTDAVGELGGTVKEYQGDALVAFWEGRAERAVAKACHAALELDHRVERLATDRSVWQVEGHPLQMDWALASGPVMINAFGGDHHAGLSMIGEPIVLAFRLEKFANSETGRVLVCPMTRQLAEPRFEFRSLGQRLAKGFDKPDTVFALTGELPERTREVG